MKTLVIAMVVGAAFGLLPTDADANGFPVHGNWCGLRHGGGDPVDALDEACKRHDECYKESEFDCGCDARLLEAIDELPGGGPPIAAAIRSWFTDVQPCKKGILPMHPGMNNAVRSAGTLMDKSLNKKDLKAGLEIATTSFVPGARAVGGAIRDGIICVLLC